MTLAARQKPCVAVVWFFLSKIHAPKLLIGPKMLNHRRIELRSY